MLKDAQACLSMHKHTAVGNTNANDKLNVNDSVNDSVNVNADNEQAGLPEITDTHTNKKAYGLFSNVYLTDDEYKLVKTSLPEGQRKLDSFSAYMKSSGKDYSDHYARLINWSCYDDTLTPKKQKKQPGERREPTFDVEEFRKKAINIKFVPPEE